MYKKLIIPAASDKRWPQLMTTIYVSGRFRYDDLIHVIGKLTYGLYFQLSTNITKITLTIGFSTYKLGLTRNQKSHKTTTWFVGWLDLYRGMHLCLTKAKSKSDRSLKNCETDRCIHESNHLLQNWSMMENKIQSRSLKSDFAYACMRVTT